MNNLRAIAISMLAFGLAAIVAALVMSLLACAQAPSPVIVVRFADDKAWTPDERAAAIGGATTWVPIGFSYSDHDAQQPECRLSWPATSDDCAITVGIVRDPQLRDGYGVDGTADRATNIATVDARWSGFDLTAIVAHEVGHIILNTPEHVADGVMSARGARWNLTDDDRDLACATVGRGC